MSFERLQLGRYQLHQKVGSGGMGEVYLAEDSRIHRQVAIKVVRNEPTTPFLGSESSRLAAQLFEREMKIISQLDHPYILPLYDYGEAEIDDTKITYMVMPYRPEGSLLTWLQQHQNSRPLSPQDVATFIEQAASALHHAHERQVIHQDIKPSNFLIRVRPEEPYHPDLLLTDFGISRSTATISNTSQLIQGTPTYMAPEQWEGHPTYASDQYALAVMTYELLVGRPPFQGKPGPMMYQHMTATPPEPSGLNPKLSPAIDAVLLRALAKKSQERFASVSAFATALQQAIIGELPTLPDGYPQAEENTILSSLNLNTSEAEGEAMALSDPHTSMTPATPSGLPGLIALPQVAAPSVHTVVPPNPAISANPVKADMQRMNQNNLPQPQPLSNFAPPAESAGPGTPSLYPVPGMVARPAMHQPTSSIVRIVLIALVLVLGTSGVLLYAFVVAPGHATNNAPSSHQTGGATLAQQRNTTTPTVHPTDRATATIPASVQAQPTTKAQATTQVQPTATANTQSLAHSQATATAAVVASTIPLYRLFNSKLGDHFYTTSAPERDRAIAQYGYHSEGVAAYVMSTQIANSTPLYRLVNAKLGDHFYTASAQERDHAIAQAGYTYEGIACYVMGYQAANTIPLYRLYSSKLGDHFYTTSAPERDRADTQDSYVYEGIAAYVFSR